MILLFLHWGACGREMEGEGAKVRKSALWVSQPGPVFHLDLTFSFCKMSIVMIVTLLYYLRIKWEGIIHVEHTAQGMVAISAVILELNAFHQ